MDYEAPESASEARALFSPPIVNYVTKRLRIDL